MIEIGTLFHGFGIHFGGDHVETPTLADVLANCRHVLTYVDSITSAVQRALETDVTNGTISISSKKTKKVLALLLLL